MAQARSSTNGKKIICLRVNIIEDLLKVLIERVLGGEYKLFVESSFAI